MLKMSLHLAGQSPGGAQTLPTFIPHFCPYYHLQKLVMINGYKTASSRTLIESVLWR